MADGTLDSHASNAPIAPLMTVPKVAVICAAHTGNAGMLSVDTAAVAFFAGQTCDFDLFITQFANDDEKVIAGRKVKHLKSLDDLQDYTHIVYWGDFLNNPNYGKWDFARLDQRLGFSASDETGYERWADLYSLRQGVPDARVVSIGNNFQHDLSGPQFQPALSRMANGFSAFLPRDPFSTKNLARHFDFHQMTKIRQGLDCAFLLPSISERRRPEFSYFFGRSGFAQTDDLVKRIESLTGLRGVPIDQWLSLPGESDDEILENCRRQIAASQFTLSDVYHLSINSFVLRTPVIGLGRAQLRQKGTLGDFKKRSLFEMMGQSDLYFEQSDQSDDAFYDDIIHNLSQETTQIESADRFDLAIALSEKFQKDVEEVIFK